MDFSYEWILILYNNYDKLTENNKNILVYKN